MGLLYGDIPRIGSRTNPHVKSKAKKDDSLPLVIAMLILAVLPLALTILAVWRRPVTLRLVRCADPRTRKYIL
jgi:hypothetical protein